MRIPDQTFFWRGRTLVWFSCGAASAVAAKLALIKYPEAIIVNCDTLKDEHEDNPRFLREVSQWIGKPIQQIRSKRYRTTDEVFDGEVYMSGPEGARCTTELKKVPRMAFQYPEDIHIFGFTADEQDRIDDFEQNNPELFLDWVLRDAGLTKRDCYKEIHRAGIDLPMMYKLGYRNNNCKGCVKSASPGYWNKVRVDFPDTFKRRAEQSRRLGVRLVKLKGERIFLDELPPGIGKYEGEDLSCGPQCGGHQVMNL